MYLIISTMFDFLFFIGFIKISDLETNINYGKKDFYRTEYFYPTASRLSGIRLISINYNENSSVFMTSKIEAILELRSEYISRAFSGCSIIR